MNPAAHEIFENLGIPNRWALDSLNYILETKSGSLFRKQRNNFTAGSNFLKKVKVFERQKSIYFWNYFSYGKNMYS